jgi:hypothetical protein
MTVSNQQSPPSPIAPITTTSLQLAQGRVFGINEIVYHIFSFVDNNTLLYSVLLVCRQWFLLGRFCAVRTLDWHERMDESKLEMPYSNSLGLVGWFGVLNSRPRIPRKLTRHSGKGRCGVLEEGTVVGPT